MKCRICKTEMLVDRAVEREEDGVVEFHYKCPNKNCANFGYKKVTQPQAQQEETSAEAETTTE